MDERFCYNAHQPINNMVIVFINTVVDHLITGLCTRLFISQQIKSIQVSVGLFKLNCSF